MKYLTKSVWILLLGLLISCGSTPGDSEQDAPSEVKTTPNSTLMEEDADLELLSLETGDSMVSRSIDARLAPGWDFAQSFPMLNGIIKQDADLLSAVSSYAEAAITGKGIETDEDVEELLSQRDKLKPEIGNLVLVWDEFTSDPSELGKLDQEISKMGMRIAAVEGMFGKLVSGDMPPATLQACSPPMRAHLAFVSAAANTIGGEYPYSNMSFFADAVLAGEKLMTDFGKSTWANRDKEEFANMLRTFLGMYLRTEGDYEMAAAGYPGDGSFEFALSELESHKRFVQEHPNSKFAPHVKAMLESTSKSAYQPEELYVVYDAYFESREEARKHQFDQLMNGKDLLHLVPVELGNGKTNWLVSYRFYEDSEQAVAFFAEREKEDEDIKMMLCTWYGEGFVQSGI